MGGGGVEGGYVGGEGWREVYVGGLGLGRVGWGGVGEGVWEVEGGWERGGNGMDIWRSKWSFCVLLILFTKGECFGESEIVGGRNESA